MAKKLPILRRLEIALGETSSRSEKEIVYGRLYKTAIEIININSETEFYGKITQKSLDPSYNRKEFSMDEIQNGKELAENLNKYITIPSPGNSKNYRGKMKKSMTAEFEYLKRYFKNG